MFFAFPSIVEIICKCIASGASVVASEQSGDVCGSKVQRVARRQGAAATARSMAARFRNRCHNTTGQSNGNHRNSSSRLLIGLKGDGTIFKTSVRWSPLHISCTDTHLVVWRRLKFWHICRHGIIAFCLISLVVMLPLAVNSSPRRCQKVGCRFLDGTLRSLYRRLIELWI